PNQGAVMIWGGMAGGPSSVTVVRGGNMGTASPVIMGGPAGSQAAQKPKPVVNANFGLNRRGGESSATSLEQKAGLVNSLERQLSFGDDQNTNGNANIMMQIPISSWKTFLSLDLSSNFSDRKSDQNTQYGVYALDAGSTLQLIRPE